MNENNVSGKCYFNNINYLYVLFYYSMFYVIRGEIMNFKSLISFVNIYIKVII